jgi:hypothetical protein
MVLFRGFGNSVDLGDCSFDSVFFFQLIFFQFLQSDCLGLDGCLIGILFRVFFFLEIFFTPGIFAEQGLVHGAGIDDHAGLDGRFEVDAAQV